MFSNPNLFDIAEFIGAEQNCEFDVILNIAEFC